MYQNLTLDDSWVGAEGVDDDGLSIMVRYRPNLQNFIDTGAYTSVVDMVWSYDTDESSLMPSPGEMGLMEKVEDALIAAFEHDNHTILAFVYTGQGERRWWWYSINLKEAAKRLNNALGRFEKLPLDIETIEDPEWAEYFAFVEDFSDGSE